MVCLEAADAVDLSRISMQSRPRRLRQALSTSKRRGATCKQRESQMKVVVVVVVVKGCTPALVFCSGSSNQLTPNSGKRLCHKQRKTALYICCYLIVMPATAQTTITATLILACLLRTPYTAWSMSSSRNHTRAHVVRSPSENLVITCRPWRMDCNQHICPRYRVYTYNEPNAESNTDRDVFTSPWRGLSPWLTLPPPCQVYYRRNDTRRLLWPG